MDWQAITDYDCYSGEDEQNDDGKGDDDGGGDDGATDMKADASTENSNMDVDEGTAADGVPPSEKTSDDERSDNYRP